MNPSRDDPPDAFATSRSIQSAAAARGFNWPDITGVLEKAHEELREIESAWRAGDIEHARRELGDVLFATVNAARFLEADPATELQRANERFNARFALLRATIQREGRVFEQCTLEELDVVWERVKKVLAESARKGQCATKNETENKA